MPHTLGGLLGAKSYGVRKVCCDSYHRRRNHEALPEGELVLLPTIEEERVVRIHGGQSTVTFRESSQFLRSLK
jgi:hypothetical protein